MADGKRSRIQIRNQERILAAAQTVFADHGFKGATMERIAQLAEMSQPNLHFYFKTKTDLYVAVLERTLQIWLQPISDLVLEGEPAHEIRRYIRTKLEMTRQNPEASRVFAHEMLDGAPVLQSVLETSVRAKALAFADVILGWIKEGRIRPIDPHHLLFLIWATTQHYADYAPQVAAVLGTRKLRKVDFETATTTICDVVLSGLLLER